RTMDADPGHVTFGQTGLITTSPQTSALCSISGSTLARYFDTQSAQTFSASVVSLEVWTACTASTGTDNSLVGLGDLTAGSTFMWWLRRVNGQPNLQTTTGGTATNYAFGGADLRDNLPHQIVTVADGSHVTAYVDGVQIGQQTQTAALG